MADTFEEINATLNELMLEVFSGVDYVSRIALETSKSIPVVHRQLEDLVHADILTRERQGKRVAYGVNWVRMADIITALSLLDPELLLEGDDAKAKRLSASEMKLAAKEFLAHPYTQELMRAFFSSLKKSKPGSVRHTFRESMQLFLDVFGMLSEEERASFAKKIDASARVRLFLDRCAERYAQKLRHDPRAALAQQIRKGL